MSQTLLLVLPFAGAMLLVWAIFQLAMDLRTAGRRKVLDRLTESRPDQKQRNVAEIIRRQHAAEGPHSTFEGLVARMRLVSKFQTLLDQADVDWSASKMLLNEVALGLMLGALLTVLQMGLIAAVGAGVSVVVLPLLWLMAKRKKRLKVLIEQLPDVYDLMGQALQAGHSLASAIQLISKEMPDPIGGEFGRVFHEQNLGISMNEALLNMAKRTDQLDIRFFVTSVLIQRETGGDLAEILDKSGKVIRDRIQLFGMVRALTAEGRLSGWVLLLLPAVCFGATLVLNPAYVRLLLDNPTGNWLLITAILMDLVGLAMIRKIVNIKV